MSNQGLRMGMYVACATLLTSLLVWGNFRLIKPWIVQRRAASFQSVEAVVDSVETVKLYKSGRKGRSGYDYFEPRVHYRYVFGGQENESHRFSYYGYPEFREPVEAIQWASSYSEGDDLTVYVNPNNPSQSVINNESVGLWRFVIQLTCVGCMDLFLMLIWLPVWDHFKPRRLREKDKAFDELMAGVDE